jgi:hypothetical protein
VSTVETVPPYVFAQSGTFAAPFEFDVPASLEIRPDTAHATFDGTGAGGSFLACLSFYDSNGNLLCRMFDPTTVAAGDLAEVTFVPPFGSAASSVTPSSSGAVTLLYEYTLPSGQQNIDTDVDGPMAGLLSQAFSVLEIWAYVRTDENVHGSLLEMQFNNDTAARYDQLWTQLSPTPGTNPLYNNNANFVDFNIPGSLAPANRFGMLYATIPNYAGSIGQKVGKFSGGGLAGSNALDTAWNEGGFCFHPTTIGGITRLRVRTATGNLITGSSLYVYGRS